MKLIKKRLIFLFLLLGFASSVQLLIAQTPRSTEQEKEYIVYVTDTGEKYHGTNCGYLHSSKRAIELSKAKSAGYTACSRCGGSNSYYPESKSSSTSVQCSGTTQKGYRCKRMTTSSNGRCYQH